MIISGVRVQYMVYTESGENHNLLFSMGSVVPSFTSVGSNCMCGVALRMQSVSDEYLVISTGTFVSGRPSTFFVFP